MQKLPIPTGVAGGAPTAPDIHRSGRLARGGVPPIGLLAQSVGLIGPSIGAGLITVPLFALVGPLAWLVWPIGTLALLCVAYGITILGRRFLTTGGLYPLAAKAGGRTTGYFTAFGALFWLIVAAPAVVLATGLFLSDLLSLSAFGLKQSTAEVILISTALGFIAAWVAYAGIKISLAVLLGLELFTASVIVALLVATLITHHSGVLDHRQFHFGGLRSSALLTAVVLVVYFFGGFESATVLGQEATAGRKSIPFAVIGSVLVAGLFLTAVQYVTVLGFSGTHMELASSPNPLGDLATVDGMRWYAYVIDGSLAVAAFANNIAVFNAGSRMLYTLPREGAPAKWLLWTSRRYLTPVAGIVVFLLVDVGTMMVLGISGANTLSAWGNLGTLSGYGAIVMYVVTLVAVLAYLFHHKPPRSWLGFAASILGGGIMCYAMYKSFNPFPAYPADVYAWFFLAAAAAAVLGYGVFRRRSSNLFAGVSVDEDSAVSSSQ